MSDIGKVRPGKAERIAVVLAAGKGTRMRSERPKVLHEVAGRPLLEWVLYAARESGCGRILVVVGHGADEVRMRVQGDDLVWVEQREQLGTGHALAQAEPHVEGAATLLVLSGDVPLVRAATLGRLFAAAENGWGAMAVTEMIDPGALGRVIDDGQGRLERIVEASDASPEELLIRRINAGIYALPAPQVFADLERLKPDNKKGELYLTDALGIAAADGRTMTLVDLDDPSEALGVNRRSDLANAHRAMLDRRAWELMDAGVTILEPARTSIEPGVEVGADTVIHPGVTLLGKTKVGAGCVLHQGAWIRDSVLGDSVEVHPLSVLDGAEVARRSSVGPYARLRPEAILDEGAKVGNFVEVKKARLGAGSKANHLAYVGDALVGRGANIGAGVVTCNYDGTKKHLTEIGDGAFVGSDTMLVAPVRVGRDATTGAGSVITDDVPDEALGVGRARQRNIDGWARRRPRKKKTGGEEAK